jgi:hypothetical protein
MTETKKTLPEYKSLTDAAVKNLEAAYGELGKILVAAEIDLGRKEYDELVLHLKHQGISTAQIAAARGVAQKKIDPTLLFYAIPAATQARYDLATFEAAQIHACVVITKNGLLPTLLLRSTHVMD